MILRQVAIDCETTGLSKRKGHRMIEFAAVELDNYARTGQTREWRFRVPPDTPMDAKAFDVHGIAVADLQGERTFAECLPEVLDFLKDCYLIGFNIGFDTGWFDEECKRVDTSKYMTGDFSIEKWARTDPSRRSDIDTRAMMKERWKDKKWSLDTLCRILAVNTEERIEHGALLDAQLTAECYIRMMKGGTGELFKKEEWRPPEIRRLNRTDPTRDDYIGPLLVIKATPEEVAEHDAVLKHQAEHKSNPLRDKLPKEHWDHQGKPPL